MTTHYAYRGAPPTTLTAAEQRAVLVAASGWEGFRDHLIVSMALGCGLREHEIAALDVCDVVPRSDDDVGRVPIRRRIRLRVFKGHRRAPARHVEWVVIPEDLRRKLARYVRRFETPTGSLLLTAPLFRSRQGGDEARLSLRQIRTMWQRLQVRAGLERHHRFHALRHTFVTAVYRQDRDQVLAQRMARHRRPETTAIYTHASDDDMERAADRLRT
jgi:integrase/recombinase XerC